jgi:hypothetical protein
MTNSGWSNSTGSPFSTSMRRTVPATLGLDLVHHLHRLDDAQGVADLDVLPDFDEGRLPGDGAR